MRLWSFERGVRVGLLCLVMVGASLATTACGDSAAGGGDGGAGQDGQGNALCGNGTVEGAEECDDGQANSDTTPNACRTNCVQAFCGDSVLDTDEECDDGPQNSDGLSDACRRNCRAPTCGDSVIDPEHGESCDDGNFEPGDGCNDLCQVEMCGNGTVDLGEVCDDGNFQAGDGCAPDCRSDESCGNRVVDVAAGETCDCGTNASLLPTHCAAVNGDPASPCTADCLARGCGNGVEDPGELCDDGNNTAGDGCSPDCQSDESCGNEVVDVASGETCDLGANNSDAPDETCRTDCLPRRCGDGIVDPGFGEQCEPGSPLGRTCTDLGFYDAAGILGCTAYCTWDTSGCTGYCGDQERNGPELCDGEPETGDHCLLYGYDVGGLTCTGLCTPNFTGCHRMGWVLQPTPVSHSLAAVWGAAPNDLWAVGAGSGILHYNGTSWSVVQEAAMAPGLNGIWGSSATDIFAVGGMGTILHWNGTAWSAMTSPATNNLYAVAGSSATNVFAVGSSGRIYHWNGVAWSQQTSPTTNTLDALWVVSATESYAVGSSGTVIRYDGSAWTVMTTGFTTSLNAVWGSSADDLFAVGLGGHIYHWDGATWTDMPSPTTDILEAVWGSSGTDVWAGSMFGSLLHYDGVAWAEVPCPTANGIHAFFGFDGARVHAVGSSGTAMIYQGAHWSDRPGGYSSTFDALWGAWIGEVIAVDSAGRAHHSSGAGWSILNLPSDADLIYGLWGTRGNDVIGVGGLGAIADYNGTAWTTVVPASMTGRTMGWIWGADREHVWAVTDTSQAQYFDGSSWSTRAVPTTLKAIWGTDVDDIHATATNGRLFHYDGTTWSQVTSPVPVTTSLDAIWGAAPDRVFAVGSGGVALHWDGSVWRQEPTPTTQFLNGIWGTSEHDVIAVGSDGEMLHWDGHTWDYLRSHTLESLLHIWGQPGKAVYVAGSQGVLQRLEYPYGNVVACRGNPTCPRSDVKLAEVYGGTPDYIELVNTGCCAQDLAGLSLSYRMDTDLSTLTYTFGAGDRLAPGGVIRVVDVATGLGPNERYAGANISDNPYGDGWVALCDGPCDLTTCANVIDYIAKQGATLPAGAPSCARFTPQPWDVTGLPLATDLALVRRALVGGGATGRYSDWTLAPHSRD